MQLFKSLLLALLIVGTLNSCKKDDGGGDTDKTDNSDTTKPNYTVAAVNFPYWERSYVLTKESNDLEGYNFSVDGEILGGEITYDTKGNPVELFIIDEEPTTLRFNYEEKLITDIEWVKGEDQGPAVFNLFSHGSNTYSYWFIQEEDKNDKDVYIETGFTIKVLPSSNSIKVLFFEGYKDGILKGLVEYEDSIELNYRKSCKTSSSINALNLFNVEELFRAFENYQFGFIPCWILAKILDDMGATYFIKGDEENGDHQDYKVTFNDNNLPVRVDALVARRIWTATYQ